MIRFLSDLGRLSVVVAALLTIVAGTVCGYLLVRSSEYASGIITIRGGIITPAEIVGGIVGMVIGVVAAGVLLGAIATLYDIRDNVRRLVRVDDGALGVEQRPEFEQDRNRRIEPTI
jgi:hypothetical protein